MIEVEEKVDTFSRCPVCENERYILYESPICIRDSLGEAIADFSLKGKQLEIRVCLNCGCLYMRNHTSKVK